MYLLDFKIFLVSSESFQIRVVSRLFLIAEMTSRLKAPDPTMRLGPRSSCLKLLKTMPTMLSRISGADLTSNRMKLFSLRIDPSLTWDQET